MGVNDPISSQEFRYGKREECKELMVFGSHNKILNTLRQVLHCINHGKWRTGNNFFLIWAICGCEISGDSRKESQLLFKDMSYVKIYECQTEIGRCKISFSNINNYELKAQPKYNLAHKCKIFRKNYNKIWSRNKSQSENTQLNKLIVTSLRFDLQPNPALISN